MVQWWMNRLTMVPAKPHPLNWFFLVCIVFFVFALSPKWTLGDHLLIDWGYNDYISRTFRGTGRFIWPLHYIILFWVSRKLFLLRFKTSYNVILLLIVLILQTLDLSPLWKRKPYIDERFNNLTFGNQIKHLISLSNKVLVYPPYTSNIAGYCDYIYFVDIAQHYRKPITAGYGARFPEQIGRAFRDSVADLSNYLKDHPQDIVVTNADSLLLHQHLIKSLGGKSYQFDRYRVYLPPSLVSKSIQSMVDDDSWQVTAKSEAISLKDYLSASLDDYICGVVQQEAMSGIKKETKEFLKSRGAPMDSIVFGTSWAFVWYGGKFIRQHYSNSMAVHDSIQLQGCTTPIHVNLLSGGHLAGKNESSIRVNGVEHSKMKRGLNLIVMDSCGQVKDKVHMDGYVSDAWIVR